MHGLSEVSKDGINIDLLKGFNTTDNPMIQ